MTVDDGYVLQDSDYPAIPERDGYRGEWDTYTSPITSNMTIQANYIAVWHTVKFVANGVTVKTITVDVGYVLKAADYPEIPIRVGYVSSWNQYTGPITSNITIQASYVRSDHLVRFIDDGTLVKTMTVGHGYVLKDWDYPELPEVAGYRVSWNKYSEPITADLVVWANYAVAPHTVTFVADGVTVKTMEVEDGYVLTDGDYPAVPEKEGYWGSWNVQTAPITQDTTIRAVYRLAHMHTVTFVASGKTVKTLSVPDGYTLKSSDYPEVPQKTGYDGKWKEYTAPVTADITIQAVYTPGTPVPTLPTDPGDLMSLEDEMPTEAEESEEPEAAASEEVAATSSSPAMILVSTVTEQHSYIYASGRLLRETITTTAADGTVTTEVLDFAYDAQGTPYSLTYTNGTASPATYYYITNLQGDVTQLIDSTGKEAASYSYDPYGKVMSARGAMAETNPLRYRGYYYDADTELYYLQSRYYDANVCRFINADSYASTGQGFLGCNMFAYCRNNPANRTDLGGYADEAAQEKTGQNMENMLAFFGVDSSEGLPEMPDDCMVFLENTWTFPIYGTSFVHGTSIVMDADKYCTYSFWGFSLGASGIPYDFSVTKGYVYGVENIEDFCGNFYGTAFNGVADIEGGAWARNGVHSEIICGNGFMSASAGFSITRYDTPQKSWKYGKAKINWYNNPHNPFGARQIVEI